MLARNNPFLFKEAQDQMALRLAAYKPSKTIERIEIKIDPVDMLSWLSLQRDTVKIYGANQNDTMSIAGIGQAVCMRGKRLGDFKKIFRKLRSFLSPKYPYLQWYGGFCFDQAYLDEDWKEFGAYRFVIPRFELAAQEGKMIFCCNLMGNENKVNILKELKRIVSVSSGGLPLSAADRHHICNSISSPRESHSQQATGPDNLQRSDSPDQKSWGRDVDRILADTSVKKVVLARKTSLHFKQQPDPWLMLRHLKAVTPNSYHFAFQFNKSVFLGASPERLYQRYQRSIASEALAGTLPKSADPGLFKKSDKNKHEHALVVDAINDSFKEFCTDFKKDKHPGILALPNGYHLITKFQGQLKNGINDEDILQYLHPTPALGGTPRKKALGLIRKLEGFSRGWYGAPVGYVGLDWAEFVVGIRSGMVRSKKLSVFAGAGIVQGSEAVSEWDEVENKISNFIKIIQ